MKYLASFDFKVPVYFVAPNSHYFSMDVIPFDINRNVLSTTFLTPAIYHPPCRSWSRMRKFANFYPGEHWLAVWSFIRCVRYGGVLEQPMGSLLFHKYIFPWLKLNPNAKACVLSVDQSWFGHLCRKSTWLFVVGLSITDIPSHPLNFDAIQFKISTSKRDYRYKELPLNLRDVTPLLFNEYLVKICKLIPCVC